jgi:hypothetical protein
LSRGVLRICEYAESMEEAHSRIIRAIDSYTENWLKRYGVEPPKPANEEIGVKPTLNAGSPRLQSWSSSPRS